MRPLLLSMPNISHMLKMTLSLNGRVQSPAQIASTPTVETVDINVVAILKGKQYGHFVQNEIYEQPDSMVNRRLVRVNFDTDHIDIGGLRAYLPVMRRGSRIVFITCASSYHSWIAT
ncbi:hypothetical protein C8R42DRAFT_720492 [Lentinula raphanica]|nr:hypothetical protein C8R42DRAFT_720492 [Lentinula raphanica]